MQELDIGAKLFLQPRPQRFEWVGRFHGLERLVSQRMDVKRRETGDAGREEECRWPLKPSRRDKGGQPRISILGAWEIMVDGGIVAKPAFSRAARMAAVPAAGPALPTQGVALG